MIFADDGTGLANYGERRPAGRPPDVRASDLVVQNKWRRDGRPPEHHVDQLRDHLQSKNVPTALLVEFEKSAASVSAAFVVGVLEREATRCSSWACPPTPTVARGPALLLDVLAALRGRQDLPAAAASSARRCTSPTAVSVLWWQKAFVTIRQR